MPIVKAYISWPMNKKELFICLCLLLIGFVVWFFPKPVEPVLFLGFSNPIEIEPKEQNDKRQLASP